jgi:predicted enzyme related to lactoylglutathione lyase
MTDIPAGFSMHSSGTKLNLNQLTIHTTKTIETAEFYKKLGLVLIVDSLPRYCRFECPDGDATLSIELSDTATSNSGVVLYFECKDLDSEVSKLKMLGLEFAHGPKDQTWLWREARLTDPAGNTICLFYGGENRKNPPWRVK